MITKQDNFQHIIKGGAKSKSFTIDTESSVIFEILRDKMYKDKLGAVAREVASNSRDANREAGTDKPVEVRIISPNQLLGIGHESISFKDYGAGINPEKMENIYLKYGASDKRTTNKLTGGFGLGAKTPFAYNDTFTVLTITDYARPITEMQVDIVEVDGDIIEQEVEVIVGYEDEKRWEYRYTGMLDESGKGMMVLFSEKEVTDTEIPTGTEIIVPIKNRNDRDEFETKVLKYTKTWGDEIAYFNFRQEQKELESVFEEDHFSLLFSTDYLYGEKIEMVIDGIPYPVDNTILKLGDTVGRMDSHFLSILKFETGELSISANRESVQYDEETIAAITERFAEYKNFLTEKLNVLVEAEDTYLNACIMTYYINRASSNKVNPPVKTRALLAHAKGSGVKLKNPTWRGIPTFAKFEFLHHNVFYVTLENGKNKYTPTNAIEFFDDLSNRKVYYGDTRKSASRNATIWDTDQRAFYLVTPHDKDSKLGIEEFMNFIFKLDLDFQLYSDVEPMKAVAGAKGVYVKKSYVTLNVRNVTAFSSRRGYPSSIQVERKTFEGANGEDFSKYVYAKVESLADSYKVDSSKLSFLAERGYTALIVREQDYENWLRHTTISEYSDTYDKVYKAWKEDLLTKKKDIALTQILIELRQEYMDDNVAVMLGNGLPKSLRGLTIDDKDRLGYDELRIVKSELKFDLKGLEKKIKRIFAERYPLLKVMKHSYQYTKSEMVKHTELYIKQVNHYYGN